MQAAAAKREQRTRMLSGRLEADATGLRKIRVLGENKNMYLQVFGVACRPDDDGKVAYNLYFLPIAVVAAGAVPPVKSEALRSLRPLGPSGAPINTKSENTKTIAHTVEMPARVAGCAGSRLHQPSAGPLSLVGGCCLL